MIKEKEVYKEGYYCGVERTKEEMIKVIKSFAKDSDTDGRMTVFEFFNNDLAELIKRIDNLFALSQDSVQEKKDD